MSRRSIAVAMSLSMLAVAACSSTAQVGGPVDPDGLAIEELTAPENLESVGVVPAPMSKGAHTTTVRPSGGTSVVNASAAETAFVAAAPPAPPAPTAEAQRRAEFGPGVTDNAIRVGAPYPVDETYDPVLKLLYPEALRPDFERVWKVVTSAINSTGGILGRRLEPVFLKHPKSAEQVCTYFTEEQRVIAVGGLEGGFAPCLDRAGIVPLSPGYTMEPDYYRRAPHLLAPLGISQWRATQLYVDGLLHQGFFAGDHKIGLIRWDIPPHPGLAKRIVRPTLARHGLDIEEELVLTWPETDDQIANAQSEGRNGVQVFKRAGIDRILILDHGSFILPEWTDYAEAQAYRPRYGLNSLNGGEWNTERKQLKGAMGIGWMPWIDLEPKHAYKHGSDGARRCKDLMDAAGESRQMDTYNEAVWTASICDFALLLKAAVEAGGPSITADSIVAGAESLGTSFQGANTLLTRFGSGRHEGVAAIRFLRWFVGCQCFRYTSDLIDAG